VTLEILARAIGARRVFELGSGFGYSAYWFARAVGAGGVVFCTDGDPANRDAAADNLTAAGLWNRVDFRVSDAVTSLRATEGEFDIVYNDVDKLGYPEAWRAARDRVRMGGLYICDNVLWSGYVATEPPGDRPGMEGRGWTEAILEHNQAVSDDPDFLSVIVPTRDGVMVALRIS
jgi:caffeoyl-CoA O-methyltransferase